jgi:ribosomal-protein-alanine N-acetyltransferase
MDARIDFMTAEDLPEVLAIEQGSFDDPWPEAVFRAELRHCWSHCMVLRGGEGTGDVVTGYVVFWSVADEVHLLNVAVDPAKRNVRYGRMLMDHMLAFAAENAARFITLEVRRSNTAAIQLYERAGFKPVGVRPHYYANNGEDAIVMLHDLGSTSQLGPLPALPDAAS